MSNEKLEQEIVERKRAITRLHQHEAYLKKAAQTDPLTGGNNRGYFTELFNKEIERCRRYARTLSVLMLDIDHFKSVNDTKSHAAGDEALCALSRALDSMGLRETDFWGRLGGEEFAVVLPETELHRAVSAAERLRTVLSGTPVVYGGESFFITVSIGVSEYSTGDSWETLLHRADHAMYKAKQTGRDRACSAP